MAPSKVERGLDENADRTMSASEADIDQFPVVFGRDLLSEAVNFIASPMLVVTMADLWPKFRAHFPDETPVYLVDSMDRDRLEADLPAAGSMAAVIGLGGGRAIDAAKYFAWRRRLALFQFPTALSVDAVFGHRAGVRTDGVVTYVGWAVPETIYVDYGVIASAPPLLNRAGLGDVLCLLTGVMDWRYAHGLGRCEARWPYDPALAAVSEAKAEAALATLDDIRDLTSRGIQVLVDALRWGGASYHGAGWNPRHIEGVEHFVFYALEAQTGRAFLHGQAVCLGLVVGAMMHDQRVDQLCNAVATVGIDIRPAAMGITWDDVDTALRGLNAFVRAQNLPVGIAHDFVVDDVFLGALRARVATVSGADLT